MAEEPRPEHDSFITFHFCYNGAMTVQNISTHHERHHAQAGMGTLTLVGVIVALLLVTGAGRWMWHNAVLLGDTCHNVAAEMGAQQYLGDVCDAVGWSMAMFRQKLEGMVGQSKFGDMMNLEEFTAHIAREFANATIGFRHPSLSNLIQTDRLTGASQFDFSNLNDRLGMALTQGSVGSQYLNAGKLDIGLPYLRNSANMGEFGVLSQLSLGSAYGNGTGGLPKDLNLSKHYNAMALDSIQKLQRSNSPQSQQLLGALPSSPGRLTQSLQSAIKLK